jgi:hypothetical protein
LRISLLSSLSWTMASVDMGLLRWVMPLYPPAGLACRRPWDQLDTPVSGAPSALSVAVKKDTLPSASSTASSISETLRIPC